MIGVECVTCLVTDAVRSIPDAHAWVRAHHCVRPYPLRILAEPTPHPLRGVSTSPRPASTPPAAARPPRPWSEVFEDVEWLAAAGTSRDDIAERLAMPWKAIAAAYRSHGAELRPYLRTAP